MVLWRLQKEGTILTALMSQTAEGSELAIFHGGRAVTTYHSTDPTDIFQEAESRRRKLQREGWSPVSEAN